MATPQDDEGKAVNPALEGVHIAPEDARQVGVEVVATLLAVAKRFSGPLPPPEALEHYERVLPGGAERIIAMAEREQKHRHGVEQRTSRVGAWIGPVGLVFAFLLAALALGGSIWLISNGHSVSGLVIAISEVIALSWAFISARSRQGGTAEPQASEASEA